MLIIYFIFQFVASCLYCTEIDLLLKVSAISVAVDCLSRFYCVYHLWCLLRQQPQETGNAMAIDQLAVIPVVEEDTGNTTCIAEQATSHAVEGNTDIADYDPKPTAIPAVEGNTDTTDRVLERVPSTTDRDVELTTSPSIVESVIGTTDRNDMAKRVTNEDKSAEKGIQEPILPEPNHLNTIAIGHSNSQSDPQLIPPSTCCSSYVSHITFAEPSLEASYCPSKSRLSL